MIIKKGLLQKLKDDCIESWRLFFGNIHPMFDSLFFVFFISWVLYSLFYVLLRFDERTMSNEVVTEYWMIVSMNYPN